MTRALPNWTVDLYTGSGATPVTATTQSDGSYTFTVPFSSGTTYRLCEVPPSGTWAQSQPLPTTTNVCSGSGELPKGYSLTPTAAGQTFAGENFGNVSAVGCSSPFGTSDGKYLVQLVSCKQNTFVFDSGTATSGKPFVSVWTGDQTQAEVPMVEKITWPYATNAQNQFTVIYTDTFPFVPANAKPMKYCQLDPRDTSAGDLTLQAAYQTDASKSSVLPAGETSCLITTTESAAQSFVAYVYSDIDGWRSTG